MSTRKSQGPVVFCGENPGLTLRTPDGGQL